jgi:hypothetical protein
MSEPRGIHYRRRWYYALWVTLLLLSAGALALWERPTAVDEAQVSVQIEVRQAPAGTRVQVWSGPWRQWPGPAWSGEGATPTSLLAAGSTRLPTQRVRIARRRWLKGYIPRGTHDLMMLRFTAPGEPPRYLALPLSQDIRVGMLRARGRMLTAITSSWPSLHLDGKAPDRIP